MSRALQLYVVAWCLSSAVGLLCYNCSATHVKNEACAGDFAPSFKAFNDTVDYIVNCTADNAMCFVRAWRARARHAWIVQRGCYRPVDIHKDPLPKLMNTPNRAMTCSQRRLNDAEYKVCLCRSDWCNSAPTFKQQPVSYSFKYCTLFAFLLWTTYCGVNVS